MMILNTENLIDQLFQSEGVKSLMDEMQTRWQTEQIRRNQFVADLTGEETAEFINGEIITQSPAKARHIEVLKRLIRVVDIFLEYHPIGRIFFEKSLIRLTRNDYEPDFIFYRTDKASTIKADTEVFPAPDFIVEILSPSTEKRDRGVKFRDYALHHVSEYWIIDPEQEAIEQYFLSETGAYQLKQKFSEGSIICATITGLIFPVRALFEAESLKKWTAEFILNA